MTSPRTTAALTTAAHPLRLRLLLHAYAHGSVRPVDATEYATFPPGSGTASYHVGRLVAAGLLERRSHGRYVLTQAGRLIAWLDNALARPVAPTSVPAPLDLALVSDTDAAPLDALFSPGSELLIDLVRQLNDGEATRSSIRVTRRST
jgi:hypothetical protein